MKIAAALIFSFIAIGSIQTAKAENKLPKLTTNQKKYDLDMVGFGECISNYRQTKQWRIIKKNKDTEFELLQVFCMDGSCSTPLHGILITNKKTFVSTGIPDIKMQEIGMKKMKLENGFDTFVHYFEECESDHAARSDLDFSNGFGAKTIETEDTRNGESHTLNVSKKMKPAGSCQDTCFEQDEKHKFQDGETVESCLQTCSK